MSGALGHIASRSNLLRAIVVPPLRHTSPWPSHLGQSGLPIPWQARHGTRSKPRRSAAAVTDGSSHRGFRVLSTLARLVANARSARSRRAATDKAKKPASAASWERLQIGHTPVSPSSEVQPIVVTRIAFAAMAPFPQSLQIQSIATPFRLEGAIYCSIDALGTWVRTPAVRQGVRAPGRARWIPCPERVCLTRFISWLVGA